MLHFNIQYAWQRLKHANAADYAGLLTLIIPLLLIIGRAVADVAVVLSVIFFLIHCIRTRDWSWLQSRWVQVGLVTWAYLFMSGALAIADKEAGLLRALTWGRWLLLTVAVVFWYSKISWWPRAVGWFLFALVCAVSIDTLAQYVFGMSLSGHEKPTYPGRLTGPFHRLVVGIFLARLFWPALAQLMSWAQLQTHFIKRVMIPLGFIGLSALVILLSGERMAFLLTGLSLGVFFIFARGFRLPLFVCGLPLVIAVIAVVATQPAIRDRVVEAKGMIADFDQSGYGIIFNNALIAWKQAPITGVGPKNFVLLCEQKGEASGYADAVPQTPEYSCARHPHNPYLEWLADTGLIGLALFVQLAILWSREAIQTVWRNRSMPRFIYLQQLSLAVGLVPFLWPLQGNMSIFTNWNAVLFWWTIGVILGGLRKTETA